MSADDMRSHSRFRGQLDRLRKITRRYFNLISARSEFRNQRAKERHVRRVSKIDPDTHRSKAKGKSKKAKVRTIQIVRFLVRTTIEPRMCLISSASSLNSARRFSGMIFAAISSLNSDILVLLSAR